MDQKTLINVLKQEIEPSTGCTDPGAVALAAAKSVQILGELPERLEIEVSPNVYKNGVSVGIPGTDRQGLDHAAALGVYLPERVEDNLGLLNHTDQEVAEKARRFLFEERISLHRTEEGVDPLYVKATSHGSGCQAWAIIEGDYSSLVEWGKDGRRLFEKPRKMADSQSNPLNAFPLVDIVQTIQGMDKEPLWFLMDAAFTNKKAAMLGITSGTSRLGAFYHRRSDPSFPFSAVHRAKGYTAAAAEARMLGMKVPVMAVAGSGNHGITNFLGVLSVIEELEADETSSARAMAITSAMTVYVKGFIKRMTAFCGCSVAAAPGVAAATSYLLGGTWEDMEHAMQSVVGALSGMVCDGAKVSCAYKLSTAAAAAIEYAYLATREKVYIPAPNGIVSNDIKTTFRHLGRINNPGMLETDKMILSIIEENQDLLSLI